jgi:hypothetical protein
MPAKVRTDASTEHEKLKEGVCPLLEFSFLQIKKMDPPFLSFHDL